MYVMTLKAKSPKVLQIPARLQVCPHGLVVQMTDKMKVFELLTSIKEIYHISDIREVCDCHMYNSIHVILHVLVCLVHAILPCMRSSIPGLISKKSSLCSIREQHLCLECKHIYIAAHKSKQSHNVCMYIIL